MTRPAKTGIDKRQTFSRKLLYTSDLDRDLVEALWSEADQLMEGARVLRHRRGEGGMVVRLALNGRDYVAKGYNLLGWAHTTRHFIIRSRAMRCWVNALRLREAGVLTPEPLAVYEERFGPLRKRAFLVTEFVEGVTLRKEVGHCRAGDQRLEALAAQFARLWQWLGRARIRQLDMNATNFIVDRDGRLWMVDLDVVRFPPLEGFPYARKRAKDRARFLYNWRRMPGISAVFAAQMDAVGDSSLAVQRPGRSPRLAAVPPRSPSDALAESIPGRIVQSKHDSV